MPRGLSRQHPILGVELLIGIYVRTLVMTFEMHVITMHHNYSKYMVMHLKPRTCYFKYHKQYPAYLLEEVHYVTK